MTKPLRCLLVDDELPALDELSFLLSGFDDVEIAGTARSAGQALEEIARLRPDVVFQDIQMPGGTGFSVLERAMLLPGEAPLFVFATAYDQYAIRAFEDNAVDYLLKPVSMERLAKCLNRLRVLTSRAAPQAAPRPDFRSLLRGMGLGPSLTRLSVDNGGRVLLLDHEDVVFIRTEERRTMVLTREGCFPAHGPCTLDRLEQRLEPL